MRSLKIYEKALANFAQTFAVKFIFCLIIILLHNVKSESVFGQPEKVSESIIEIAEELAADESDPEAVSVFIDRLHELSENRVSINTANDDDLSRLFFLSDFQVKAIKDYRKTSGSIVSVYEIANIPGFDKETAEMMAPFIRFENRLINSGDSAMFMNSLISNFSYKPHNHDTSSIGSGWKILSKYKFVAGGFSGGCTTEKDPGEKFLSGAPPRPEFLSGYLSFRGEGLVKNIIVGDYSARFGQGLNINTGMSRSISLTSTGYMSSSDEIKPYTSSDESRYFHGAATKLALRNFEFSVFISRNYSDATLTSSSGSSNDYIESFSTTGIHNTVNLLKKKDNINILAYGFDFSYSLNKIKTGFVWSKNKISLPVNPVMDDPEKVFDFRGDESNLYSLYYNSLIKKILFYGEFTSDNFKKYGIIQGFSLRPSDRLTVNVLLRNYKSGFTTFYGHGPGISSNSSNEKGILVNFSFEAFKHVFINGGIDRQEFPWLKYRCSAPSTGLKKELKVRIQAAEDLMIEALYHYQYSMIDNTLQPGVPIQDRITTRSLKLSARYIPYDNLTLTSRAECKLVNPAESNGFMLCQDVNYTFRKFPLTIWARLCIFNTTDWSSRIYVYENDLLYSFSIPALSGEGSRSYIMAKLKVGDSGEIRIKYGVTSLTSGENSIENSDEIKMQVRIWF
jgi:DNA uptake protein ComE-like DNA-binding protein